MHIYLINITLTPKYFADADAKFTAPDDADGAHCDVDDE